MLSSLLMIVSKTGAACAPGSVKVLVPWYQYLTLENDCSIRKFQLLGSGSDLPLIVLALIDNLIRLAGIIAVVFIIYGAVMYVTSQGNPEQTGKAQTTIINALVGLVVAVIAVSIVSFLGGRLIS